MSGDTTAGPGPGVRGRSALTATIGAWTMASVLLRSLVVPLEDGFDPRPPDGVSP